MSVVWLIVAIIVFLLMIGCAYLIFRFYRNQEGFDRLYLSVAVVFMIIFEVLLALTLFISIYMCLK